MIHANCMACESRETVSIVSRKKGIRNIDRNWCAYSNQFLPDTIRHDDISVIPTPEWCKKNEEEKIA